MTPHLAPPVAHGRILIVDDDAHKRALLSTILAADGFDVAAVATGAEALTSVARTPPDVILLDIMMPDMDGYAVTRALKADRSTRHIPVILVTALDDRDARLRGLHEGAEDFLTTPVDRFELAVRVRNHLRAKAFHDAQLRFKDEFLSHVSHELRSPLTAIKQFSSILLSGIAGVLTEEQRTYQEIVQRNVYQLQAMIDDLLEVTRLETGKLTVEPERVVVADAVHDALDTLRRTANERGIVLDAALPGAIPAAYADATRLRQALIILLDNAIKFSPVGSTIRVALSCAPGEHGPLRIDISDHGIGMSPDMLSRIFDRHFQAPDGAAASRKGLGLGLFICRQLVTRQGGELSVVSALGVGSTFTFTVPVFSLDSTLAPLLRDGHWPGDALTLLVVDVETTAAWPSVCDQDMWSHALFARVQRCLLPDLDVLLPSRRTSSHGERLFIAAFADARGASILANRIQGQLEQMAQLAGHDAIVTVASETVPAWPQSTEDSPSTTIAQLARHLDSVLTHYRMPEAAAHELHEDSGR